MDRHWSGLSLHAIERILRSPAVCQAVRIATDRRSIARTVNAEFILDQCPGEHLDEWSALGDVWLGTAIPPGCDSAIFDYTHGRFCSPALDCGIPLDLSLAPALQYPRASMRTPYTPGMPITKSIIERLNTALSVIQTVSDAAYDSVLALTSNLVLRTDQEAPEEPRSASSAAALGRTVLINAHSTKASVSRLAEALVHEATHTAISTVELEIPLVTDFASLLNAEVRSPWSGSFLPIHAFLHACIVWFALLNFWTRAERANVLPNISAVRIREIRAGFAEFRMACLKPYQRHFSSGTISLLKSIHERVTGNA